MSMLASTMWFLIYGRELRTIRHTIVPPYTHNFQSFRVVVGKLV